MVLFFFIEKEVLLIVDIHGDFKTKTNITVFRCFPFHSLILFFNVKINTVVVDLLSIMQLMCHIVKNIFIYIKNN